MRSSSLSLYGLCLLLLPLLLRKHSRRYARAYACALSRLSLSLSRSHGVPVSLVVQCDAVHNARVLRTLSVPLACSLACGIQMPATTTTTTQPRCLRDATIHFHHLLARFMHHRMVGRITRVPPHHVLLLARSGNALLLYSPCPTSTPNTTNTQAHTPAPRRSRERAPCCYVRSCVRCVRHSALPLSSRRRSWHS